jgi:hypothetical protein
MPANRYDNNKKLESDFYIDFDIKPSSIDTKTTLEAFASRVVHISLQS